MTSTSWNFQQGGGVNVKCPLCEGGGVGGWGEGMDISWNHTIFILSLPCLPKLLIIRC